MKKLTGLWLLLILFVAPVGLAWADESVKAEVAVETEVVETLLDPAKVAQKEQLLVQLSGDKVFSFDVVPDREQMKASLGLILPEKVKEQIIARGGSLDEVDPLLAYESLTPESQQKFQEVRALFLANAARILNSTKSVFGAGIVVGDVMSFVKVKTMKVLGKKSEVESVELKTLNQRSHEVVSSVLKSLDYKLFSQAPLVIESNEFGLSVSLGLVAETGVLRKGGGGAEELGFSFAFNKSQKAFVFEIFHNSEVFDNTKAAVSVIGLVGKAGITMGRREGTETMKGSTFYPPAVPGYSNSSAEYFSAGLSSSLGLPPPPLADLLTFTNKSERNALIRVTVSPVVKGFIRLQFGDVRGSVNLITIKFLNVYNAIADKIRSMGPRSCGPVFG